MPTHTPASEPRESVGALTAVAAAVRMMWCCAGPLIPGGAGLAGTGGALHSTWPVTVGAPIAGEAVAGVWFLSRPRSTARTSVWVYTRVSVVRAFLAVQAYAHPFVPLPAQPRIPTSAIPVGHTAPGKQEEQDRS
ncbi:hypothetical protein [Streptomyces sp. NPDC002845]